MRIALTGVSGFIGSFIARHLHEAGHVVTGLVRKSSRRDHIEQYVDRFVVGGQAEDSVWPDLFDGAECIIHNSFDWPSLDGGDIESHLRSNLNGAIRLLRASAPRQFIFMSSIAVHHDMRPRWRGMIDEDHPLRPAGMYGACKAAIEAHLWAEHFSSGRNCCSLRPCGVYGIDPNLVRSHGYSLMAKIQRGEAITKPGGGKFVHVDDVAAATLACVGNPHVSGRAFNLVDCYARWADWAAMACEILGVTVPIDTSSPAEPKNQFTKDAAQSLGVSLDRGHEGIRQHVIALIQTVHAQ